MSDFKYLPWTRRHSSNYNTLIERWYFRAWNHWLNPLGNWHEPLPFPEAREEEAKKSWMPPWLWWNLRNFAHNFCHFWIGITPRGRRYEWILPTDKGWEMYVKSDNFSWWKKKFYHPSIGWFTIKLPYYNGKHFHIGWTTRGSFGLKIKTKGNS